MFSDNFFQRLESIDGNPILEKDEKIVASFQDTGLYEGDNKTQYNSGILYVTTDKLIWFNKDDCFRLRLEAITDIRVQSGFLMSSPKLLLTARPILKKHVEWSCDICQFLNLKEGKCLQCGVVPATSVLKMCPKCTFNNNHDSQKCEICFELLDVDDDYMQDLSFKIAFRSSGIRIQDALSAIKLAKESKIEKCVPIKSNADASGPLGVSIIMKNLQVASKQREEVVSESSFNDLETLMQKAGEIMKIAQDVMSKLGKGDSSESNSFHNNLMDFGIVQPVTKETNGGRFIEELSKELCGFLVNYSRKYGVLQISLSDAFCLFNRARGVSLVSPHDIYRASCCFKNLDLEFQLRTYDSGFHILESRSVNDEVVVERILSHVKDYNEGISALILAKREKISVIVAKEQLLVFK